MNFYGDGVFALYSLLLNSILLNVLDCNRPASRAKRRDVGRRFRRIRPSADQTIVIAKASRRKSHVSRAGRAFRGGQYDRNTLA